MVPHRSPSDSLWWSFGHLEHQDLQVNPVPETGRSSPVLCQGCGRGGRQVQEEGACEGAQRLLLRPLQLALVHAGQAVVSC